MERPSHILFARHSSLSRTPWLGLAIAFQLAGAWLFMHGLANGIIKFVPPIIELAPMRPEVQPRTPPPPLPPERPVERPAGPRSTRARATSAAGGRRTARSTGAGRRRESAIWCAR